MMKNAKKKNAQKYTKYIYLYTNSLIKSNRNLSIQLYILNIYF